MSGRFNLEPFASPGYRRYFLAALLAALGLWVYSPALEWVILTETGLAGAVGVLQSTLIVAVALATLPSGLVTDRLGPRRTLAISLSGMGVVIAVVAALAALDALTFEIAIVLTFALGLFDGFFGVPATLLLAQVVEPRHLGSAIGLSFLTSGLGRLVGAPLGGAVLEVAGATQAFIPAAVAVGVSGLVILSAPIRRTEDHPERTAGLRGLGQAAAWLVRHPAARSVTLLAALSGLTIYSYGALLPSLTRDLLHSESATLGLLSGAGGLGAILAAVVMDTIGRRIGRGRQIVATLLASGLAIALLGMTALLPVAVMLVASIVFFSVQFGGTLQLIVQTSPPPRLRPGVVAVYTFSFYVVLPIGTTGVGLLADRFGVAPVLLGMGVATAGGTAAVLLAFRRLLGVDVDEGGEVRIPGDRREPGAGAIVAP